MDDFRTRLRVRKEWTAQQSADLDARRATVNRLARIVGEHHPHVVDARLALAAADRTLQKIVDADSELTRLLGETQ